MILILNLGGESLKFSLYGSKHKLYVSGKIKMIKNLKFIDYKIKQKHTKLKINEPVDNYVAYLLSFLVKQNLISTIDDIKHYVLRIVFCDYTNSPVALLDDQLYENIKVNITVSPIHNALSITLIDQIKTSVNNPSIICAFDSYFFNKIANKKIPLNQRLANKLKLYKRGFHGISYAYCLETFIRSTKIKKPNLVMVHLGSGCSVCLIKNGKVIDCSMSYSPLSGLLMKTRSGDLDPAILLKISEHYQWDLKQTIDYLNKQSGLSSLVKDDINKLINLKTFTKNQKQTLDMYTNSIIKYILLYLNQLTKVDGIVFTGGVCEFNSQIIRLIVDQIKLIDLDLINTKFIASNQLNKISVDSSKFDLYLLKTNENLMMLKYTNMMLEANKVKLKQTNQEDLEELEGN
ncbi:acetate/propionate family kinase [Ureaplasma diversum]|uniref:Acetate kinase (Acetokinase) n=1 Tax=Ureaplasma diversum NCTC 246 TaxID=1188241 RepID=A0A084EWA4_9BACT|nr:acetate/propionate family kinase [Ureaplasma diversum]KEZ22246.1 Acetate kinase (Acetokinase) [Ureaplasma diversum NCTC 246]